MSSILSRPEPHRPRVAPSDAELARDACHSLKRAMDVQARPRLRLADEGGEAAVFELPEAATRLLIRILDETARGNRVALVPLDAELTTQQAADMLNVSRPHLISLVEAGRIPHHKVGTHRRIRMADVVSFREAAEAERQRALDDLAAETRALGLDR